MISRSKNRGLAVRCARSTTCIRPLVLRRSLTAGGSQIHRPAGRQTPAQQATRIEMGFSVTQLYTWNPDTTSHSPNWLALDFTHGRYPAVLTPSLAPLTPLTPSLAPFTTLTPSLAPGTPSVLRPTAKRASAQASASEAGRGGAGRGGAGQGRARQGRAGQG